MHSYRKAENGNGWQVCCFAPNTKGDELLFSPVGPTFDLEPDAAAFASFLNGGRFSPGEIEHIFAIPVMEEDDDSIHPDRPKELEDYPLERKRK